VHLKNLDFITKEIDKKTGHAGWQSNEENGEEEEIHVPDDFRDYDHIRQKDTDQLSETILMIGPALAAVLRER
jgi:hypothetical protein